MSKPRSGAPHWIVVPLGLLVGGLVAALLPLSKPAAATSLGLLAALAWSLMRGRSTWTQTLGVRLLRNRAAAAALLVLTSIAVVIGSLEGCAQIATRAGWAKTYEPMQTMLPAGVEDWRLAHITADSTREPDPVLLWRSRAQPPYTPQRFKGPWVERPRPAGVFRVIAYGDSNTDGPPQGGWTEKLQAILTRQAAARYEVLNAGVVGYSSHQGLLRFRSELEYQPNLVLVSFGWNEAAPAMGPPDRSFVAPPAWQTSLLRGLLRYRSYLVVLHLLARRQAALGQNVARGPRVSLEDQAANLRGFAETARSAGARVVFLTRPTRATDAELQALAGSWRAQVPAYSRGLIEVGRELGVLVVDVRSWFAGRPELFADECHFNEAGHSEMAERLAADLEQLGALGSAAAGAGRRAVSAPRGAP